MDGKRENPLSHSKPLSEKYFLQPKLGFGTITLITAALNSTTLKVDFEKTKMEATNTLVYFAITLDCGAKSRHWHSHYFAILKCHRPL